MKTRDLLALLAVGTRKSPMPAFEEVLLAPRALELHGDGYALRYVLGDGPDLISGGAVAVRNGWMRELLGTYRKESSFRFEGLAVETETPRARLTRGARQWEYPGSPLNKAARVAAAPLGRAVMQCPSCGRRFDNEDARYCPFDQGRLTRSLDAHGRAEALAPVDFTKSGPVDRVLNSAAKSGERHPWQHAVHLAGHASATNGTVLAREALRVGLSSPALVPLPMARALVALVTATSPGALSLSRGLPRAWFKARLENGDRWSLTGNLLEEQEGIDYGRIAGESGKGLRTLAIDAGEFRGLVNVFPETDEADRHVALYADGGLVAWGSSPGGGVGSSLADYCGEPPVFVFAEVTIRAALSALPKEGAFDIEVSDDGLRCRIGRKILAGVAYVFPDGREAEPLTAGVPRWVHDEIVVAHGHAERIPEPRIEPVALVRAAFAAAAARAVTRVREQGGSTPELERDAAEMALQALAEQCVTLTELGPEHAAPLGADLASAVMLCSRPRASTDVCKKTDHPTYLVFDPTPFVVEAMPAPLAEEPKSGRRGRAVRKKKATKRVRTIAA